MDGKDSIQLDKISCDWVLGGGNDLLTHYTYGTTKNLLALCFDTSQIRT